MISYVLACLVGLSIGLLGSGGSILAVPILKYTAGLSAREAVATSLATVGSVSMIGAVIAWREGRLMGRIALVFTLLATVGTFLGVELAQRMPEKVQMGLFISIMFVATIRMFRKKKPGEAEQEKSEPKGTSLFLRAFSVGVLTGIVGVGGGFLIVPALVALFHLPMKKATGTSLAIVAVNSMVGTLKYSQSVSLDWSFTGGFVGAALGGLFVGMALSRKLEDQKLREIFAYGLVLISTYTLWREFLS